MERTTENVEAKALTTEQPQPTPETTCSQLRAKIGLRYLVLADAALAAEAVRHFAACRDCLRHAHGS